MLVTLASDTTTVTATQSRPSAGAMAMSQSGARPKQTLGRHTFDADALMRDPFWPGHAYALKRAQETGTSPSPFYSDMLNKEKAKHDVRLLFEPNKPVPTDITTGQPLVDPVLWYKAQANYAAGGNPRSRQNSETDAQETNPRESVPPEQQERSPAPHNTSPQPIQGMTLDEVRASITDRDSHAGDDLFSINSKVTDLRDKVAYMRGSFPMDGMPDAEYVAEVPEYAKPTAEFVFEKMMNTVKDYRYRAYTLYLCQYQPTASGPMTTGEVYGQMATVQRTQSTLIAMYNQYCLTPQPDHKRSLRSILVATEFYADVLKEVANSYISQQPTNRPARPFRKLPSHHSEVSSVSHKVEQNIAKQRYRKELLTLFQRCAGQESRREFGECSAEDHIYVMRRHARCERVIFSKIVYMALNRVPYDREEVSAADHLNKPDQEVKELERKVTELIKIRANQGPQHAPIADQGQRVAPPPPVQEEPQAHSTPHLLLPPQAAQAQGRLREPENSGAYGMGSYEPPPRTVPPFSVYQPPLERVHQPEPRPLPQQLPTSSLAEVQSLLETVGRSITVNVPAPNPERMETQETFNKQFFYGNLPPPWNVMPRADTRTGDEHKKIATYLHPGPSLPQQSQLKQFDGHGEHYFGWRPMVIKMIHRANIKVEDKLSYIIMAIRRGADSTLDTFISRKDGDFRTYERLIRHLEEGWGGVDREFTYNLNQISRGPKLNLGNLENCSDLKARLESFIDHCNDRGIAHRLQDPTFVNIILTNLLTGDQMAEMFWAKNRGLLGEEENTLELLCEFLQSHIRAQSRVKEVTGQYRCPTTFGGRDRNGGPRQHRAFFGQECGKDSDYEQPINFAAYDRATTGCDSESVGAHSSEPLRKDEDGYDYMEEDFATTDEEVVILLANGLKFRPCQLCKPPQPQDHLLFRCPSFRKMSGRERHRLVQRLKRCYNCLAPGHGRDDCKSKGHCNVCKERHHTLLCPKGKGQGDFPKKEYSSNPKYNKYSHFRSKKE